MCNVDNILAILCLHRSFFQEGNSINQISCYEILRIMFNYNSFGRFFSLELLEHSVPIFATIWFLNGMASGINCYCCYAIGNVCVAIRLEYETSYLRIFLKRKLEKWTEAIWKNFAYYLFKTDNVYQCHDMTNKKEYRNKQMWFYQFGVIERENPELWVKNVLAVIKESFINSMRNSLLNWILNNKLPLSG